MGEMITTRNSRVQAIVNEAQQKREWERNWARLRKLSRGVSPYPMPVIPAVHDLFSNVLADGAWAGQRCFIIGGGESLRDFDFSKLKGELVIGVNRAYERVDCTIMFATDAQYHKWITKGEMGDEAKRRFEEFKGYKVWLDSQRYSYKGVHCLTGLNGEGLSFSMKAGLKHGGNSGYGALNLAVCLGGNPIYLLGFDMKGKGGKQSWWHDGYPKTQGESVYKKFKTYFESVAPILKEKGVRVVNLNPDSAMTCFEFGKFEDIEPIKRPIIVGFYTKNTGYEKEIERLKLSLKKFSFECDIEVIESLGEWQKNVKYKARLMRKMLDKHPGENILYLDSDSVVHRYPSLFADIDADIAVHYIDRGGGQIQLNAAVIYAANNQKTKKLLEEWIKRNEADAPTWDQEILQNLLEESKGRIKVFNLPPEYCKIYDSGIMIENPVIEQYQASRRFKYEVNTNSSIFEVEEKEKKKYTDAWRCKAETPSINSKRVVHYVKRLDKQWKMIDLGCGDGAAVKALRKLGFDIVGVDITLEAIGENEKGFFEAPLWRLPFENDEFDFTFSTDALEHIPPQLVNRTIKEIYRITKVKTFHAIAPFEHCNKGFVFHLTAKPIDWWKSRFDELKNKDIEVEVMHRSDLSKFGK